MKRIVMFSAVLAVTVEMMACNQQKEAPKVVLESFVGHFENAQNIKWNQEKPNEWEAEFTMNTIDYSATFDQNGNWLETEHKIDKSELPEEVALSINESYADYSIEETEMVETPQIKTAYEVTIESGEEDIVLVIDTTGKILKKEIENDDED